jgi:hypothetical protein
MDLIKSFTYSSLDYKWIARKHLKKRGWTIQRLMKKHPGGLELSHTELPIDDPSHTDYIMLKLALSAYRYYYMFYDNIIKDTSLEAITSLCSSSMGSLDTEVDDEEVLNRSYYFNELIGSKRKLFKCYDCGTNARAAFLKLVETGRQSSIIHPDEIFRMKEEYQVNRLDPDLPIRRCLEALTKDDGINMVAIMSISIEDFGHVWVIEKKYINGVVRYHHYQSALNSHMLIDYIEAMDYGADPTKSLDVVNFMTKLSKLLNVRGPWSEPEYHLFSQLFAFMPVSPVVNPEGGFCWTWLSY